MLERTDAELVTFALIFWANWIETRDITLSATDYAKTYPGEKLKPLTQEQMELVVHLRKLARRHNGQKIKAYEVTLTFKERQYAREVLRSFLDDEECIDSNLQEIEIPEEKEDGRC